MSTCGPTAHRYYLTDRASLRFSRFGPTAHRFGWWRRRMLPAMLERSFSAVRPLAAAASRCRRLRRKPHESAGKQAMRCTTTSLGHHCLANPPGGQCGLEPPPTGVERVGSGRHSGG